jgi:hypothetical protein
MQAEPASRVGLIQVLGRNTVTVRVLVPVFLLAAQACSSLAVNCESPEFQAYSGALEASAGARFADEYFTPLRTPLDSCAAKGLRVIYIESFFEGYRTPGRIYDGDPSAEMRVKQAGIRTGEEFRRANPGGAAATYASFGYTAITVEGVWTVGFETSSFAPAEGYEGERWWLEPLPEVMTKLQESDVLNDGPSLVRITGYVGGLGEHGHLGNYQRQTYVTEFGVLASAQQSVAADRREDAAPAERQR